MERQLGLILALFFISSHFSSFIIAGPIYSLPEGDRNTLADLASQGTQDVQDRTAALHKSKQTELEKANREVQTLEGKVAQTTNNEGESQKLQQQLDAAKANAKKKKEEVEALEKVLPKVAMAARNNQAAVNATQDGRTPVGSNVETRKPFFVEHSESALKPNGKPDLHHQAQMGRAPDGTMMTGENPQYRGWTDAKISETLSNPLKTEATADLRSTPGKPQPATAYFSSENQYVVRNDATGKIVQVSNLNDPNWQPGLKPPPTTGEIPASSGQLANLSNALPDSPSMLSRAGSALSNGATAMGNTLGHMEQMVPGITGVMTETPAFQSLNQNTYGGAGLALTGAGAYSAYTSVGGIAGIKAGAAMTGGSIASGAATVAPYAAPAAAVTAAGAGGLAVGRTVDWATGNRISATGGMAINGVWDTVSGAASSVYNLENRFDYSNTSTSWQILKQGSSSWWGW